MLAMFNYERHLLIMLVTTVVIIAATIIVVVFDIPLPFIGSIR
jgi:hypothetical protein